MILKTDRLFLKTAELDFCNMLCDYRKRNSAFLMRWEPKRNINFFSFDEQYKILEKEVLEYKSKSSYKFYIFKQGEENKIIGNIAISNIIYGCFWSCFLGYAIDNAEQNKGYMTEAVKAVTEFAFSQLHLHRIEANVMPENLASKKVLDKCMFNEEGLAKKYLKINGEWRDHIHMVLLNENKNTPQT